MFDFVCSHFPLSSLFSWVIQQASNKHWTLQSRQVFRCSVGRASVDFDGSVNSSNEEVRGVEADGAGKKPEGDNHDGGVAKVEQRRDELGDLELREKIEDGVGEHVDGRTARHHETAPPPVVILSSAKKQEHFTLARSVLISGLIRLRTP